MKSKFKTHRFNNHRKYQSLDAYSNAGTGAAIESYVEWVRKAGSHHMLFNSITSMPGATAESSFHVLYYAMDAVMSFGRMAKFDYLTMIGKVGIANIHPGSAYRAGATGPVRGGRLLFGGSVSASIPLNTLDQLMLEMGRELGVGMQEIEDSLCNWQKSPDQFIRFCG